MEPIKGKIFPLSSPYSVVQRKGDIKVQATGEFRAPKKGEYYLSGAIVEAYRAPNDLTAAYWIARLVKVREVKRYVVEEA